MKQFFQKDWQRKRRERRWEEGDGGFQGILVCVCVLIDEGNFS